MASTYTTRLRLEKQGDGENPNSWGLRLNQNVIDLVDQAVGGYAVVSVSSVEVTLTEVDGATDQSRNASLEFAGTLTADVTVLVPEVEKLYFIRENTTGSFGVKLKTNTGSVISLQQSTNILVACDGSELYKLEVPTSVSAFTINTLTATSIDTSVVNASLVSAANGTFTSTVSANTVDTSIAIITDASITDATFVGQVVGIPVTLTDAASIALDLATGNNFTVTLAGNRTLENPTNAVAGQTGQMYVIQDGTGSRTLAFGSNYKFPNGTAITISTSTSSVDLLVFNVRSSTAIDTVIVSAFG
tara:strand:+ start:1744 stop:2652 length:909 start_codon:yes stop_codon:yes gene_type:complete